MAKPHHLITDQDLQAFADGELDGSRQAATQARIEADRPSAEKAAAVLRDTFDLRRVRDAIYADDALRAEVERLLARREERLRSEGEPDEAPVEPATRRANR